MRDALCEVGKLSSPEIAVRLGVGLTTIQNWARNGRLRGRRCGGGHGGRWVFDAIEEQPDAVQQLAAAHAIGYQQGRGVLSAAAAGRGAV